MLRDNGVVDVRVDGVRRWYAIRPDALTELDDWLARFRQTWDQPLDALATELARGRRERRRRLESSDDPEASAPAGPA